jgi:hypothetical protein
MNETQRALTGALNLLNGGENWIKGRYHNGEDLTDELDGTCFCSIGALDHVNTMSHLSDSKVRLITFNNAFDALNEAATGLGFGSAVRLNDHESTEFPLVREMFTKAIELAAGE